jgi:hypothetical protein
MALLNECTSSLGRLVTVPNACHKSSTPFLCDWRQFDLRADRVAVSLCDAHRLLPKSDYDFLLRPWSLPPPPSKQKVHENSLDISINSYGVSYLWMFEMLWEILLSHYFLVHFSIYFRPCEIIFRSEWRNANKIQFCRQSYKKIYFNLFISPTLASYLLTIFVI